MFLLLCIREIEPVLACICENACAYITTWWLYRFTRNRVQPRQQYLKRKAYDQFATSHDCDNKRRKVSHLIPSESRSRLVHLLCWQVVNNLPSLRGIKLKSCAIPKSMNAIDHAGTGAHSKTLTCGPLRISCPSAGGRTGRLRAYGRAFPALLLASLRTAPSSR
jgi:hypothetical protein